ncbi:MAG: NAD(P)(+) transhydrogenase (Re/Si-specific) subunit beta, partial [Gaiellaceae bacterium]
MTLAISQTNIHLAYLVASVCLIIGIKRLSSPATARSGNVIAAVGMGIAIAFTFLDPDIDTYWIILAGMAVGTVIGVASARMVKMTAIPQMVALFNGVGGGAAALIAAAEFHRLTPESGHVLPEWMGAMLFSAMIGSISFSGSLVAFAKLQELLPGSPIVFRGQQLVNGLLFAGLLG